MTLDVGDLISISVGLIGMVGGIIAVVIASVRSGKPQQIDAGVVARIEAAQQNREYVDKLERAYQLAGADKRAMFDGVVGILAGLAAFTPIKSDDAALKLLQDVKTPGVPVEVPPIVN